MTPREAELTREVAGLRELIAELRKTIERLLRHTFGRSSERDTGPTLFDGIDDNQLSPSDDTELSVSKRKGHGRRKPPAELPVQRVEIDLNEDQKILSMLP